MAKTKIALIGFVNTEEILARRLRAEGHEVHGFILFPNQAFQDACTQTFRLTEDFIANDFLLVLQSQRYDATHVGPIPAALYVADFLRGHGIAYVGPSAAQLEFELDKSAVRSIFPNATDILPHYAVVTSADEPHLQAILASFGSSFILKFVGPYSQKYRGSETGRVRIFPETLSAYSEAIKFIQDSIAVSGKAIIEERVTGKEFSSNYLVDSQGALFRLGENVCYKRRENGNQGPMCDGTGSVTIRNTLPFLTEQDIAFIEQKILQPFVAAVTERTAQPFCSMVNLDLMKRENGRVVLFEVNCREAGGHTVANLLPGVQQDLGEVLCLAQQGRLNEINAPPFRQGVSVVTSAFPPYFPLDVMPGEDYLIVEVSRDVPLDAQLYTGWVEVLAMNHHTRSLKLFNSPSLLFEHSDIDLSSCRRRLLEVVRQIVPQGLHYRTDIGEEFESSEGSL